MLYRGYSISQNDRRIDKKCKLTGVEWTEYELIPNSYTVYGFMSLHHTFKSEKRCMEYVDFLIRCEEILPFRPVLRSLDKYKLKMV